MAQYARPMTDTPGDELAQVLADTSDGDQVIEGIDPEISQDADPHPQG